MSYLFNTAAAVRVMGIQKSRELAAVFKRDWVVESYIPTVLTAYKAEKKGYNFRICCLQSLEAVCEHITPDDLQSLVIP